MRPKPVPVNPCRRLLPATSSRGIRNPAGNFCGQPLAAASVRGAIVSLGRDRRAPTGEMRPKPVPVNPCRRLLPATSSRGIRSGRDRLLGAQQTRPDGRNAPQTRAGDPCRHDSCRQPLAAASVRGAIISLGRDRRAPTDEMRPKPVPATRAGNPSRKTRSGKPPPANSRRKPRRRTARRQAPAGKPPPAPSGRGIRSSVA